MSDGNKPTAEELARQYVAENPEIRDQGMKTRQCDVDKASLGNLPTPPSNAVMNAREAQEAKEQTRMQQEAALAEERAKAVKQAEQTKAAEIAKQYNQSPTAEQQKQPEQEPEPGA